MDLGCWMLVDPTNIQHPRSKRSSEFHGEGKTGLIPAGVLQFLQGFVVLVELAQFGSDGLTADIFFDAGDLFDELFGPSL